MNILKNLDYNPFKYSILRQIIFSLRNEKIISIFYERIIGWAKWKNIISFQLRINMDLVRTVNFRYLPEPERPPEKNITVVIYL